nr:DUF4870 domain-containing protein [uncultured Methanobrevibacter sp.]
MAETKELIIAIIGYLLAIISPIIGIIAGIIIHFTQKENPFLNKHGKYIIIVAVAMWVITIILMFAGFIPAFF